MYGKLSNAAAAGVGGAGTAGGLASTGVGSVLWMVIAAITLIAVGAAMLRISPRIRRHPID
ncbi:hypothetical protein LY12_000561 [Prauserella alba]|uniref:LPXTG-motif cell wall anchor domain-containing protein n=1 Tax=Prauserella alba TaxID=176898 RepID=A0ABN1VBC3_9PSEU|nr:hypothetical protein [Prauserella alba]